MRRSDHPLPGQSLGHQTTVTSLHFGTAGTRPKAYIQASLHAEELPGMLAAPVMSIIAGTALARLVLCSIITTSLL